MLITKYKFNNTLYDLFPEFNSGFEFTYTDEVNGEVTTRTIESDNLPTNIVFGDWNNGNGATDKTKALLRVEDINTSNVAKFWDTFFNCENLEYVNTENFDTSNSTLLHGVFSFCKKLNNLDVSNFDTTNVTDMANMFQDCTSLTNLDVSGFDTAKVTQIQYMFCNCSKLTSLDVSGFDTSKVTLIHSMFNGCSNLTSLDVSGFDTSNVTNMNGMFYGCSKLTSLDVSNFNTTNVINMGSMFRVCSSLTNLDVSDFDTSNVANMDYMFSGCSSLTNLDVSNFDTTNITNMDYMFNLCSNLTSLDVSGFDTSKVTNMNSMFNNCNILKYLKCNNVTTLNTLNKYLPTKSSTSQGTIICKSDVTNLDTTSLQSKYWAVDTSDGTMIAKYKFDKSIHNSLIPEFNSEFSGYFCNDVIEDNIVTREIVGYGGLPTLMKFGGRFPLSSSLLEILDINTSEVTEMGQMFFGCKKLSSICGDKFNTSKVTNLGGMFYDCSSLKVIDISSWDVSNVKSTYCMFQYCQNLISVGDLSNWNTSKMTDLGGMFLNCMKLASLNISTWDVSNVTSMWQMFYYCYSLTSLDLSNWDMGKVTDIRNTLVQTTKLKDIGLLYCNASTIQKIINAIPTDLNKTLWYKEANIDNITYNNNIALKKYIEENIEIVLNSPLLQGDSIEVVDGKLCHYHKMGMVVLDGSETSWQVDISSSTDTTLRFYMNNIGQKDGRAIIICPTFKFKKSYTLSQDDTEGTFGSQNGSSLFIDFSKSKLSTVNVSGFKQWLQANPITVVYELAEPYYEDITPYQSSIALRTFEECNVQIITALPIKTKITYRTNITSAVVLEQELDTLDSGVSLSNLIEEEVDE